MSHDFDYIAYVPFRNYVGWGVAWYSASYYTVQGECGVDVRQLRTVAR